MKWFNCMRVAAKYREIMRFQRVTIEPRQIEEVSLDIVTEQLAFYNFKLIL
jgi:hypothetical protein